MTRRRGLTLADLLILAAIVAVAAVFWIVATSPIVPSANRAVCQSNLSQMYKAMHVYVSAFGKNTNYMPHSGDAFFTCLLGHGAPDHPPLYATKAPFYGNLSLYVCPSSGSDDTSVQPGSTMVDYRGPKRHANVPAGCPSALVDGIPADYIIGCDAPVNHKGSGGNVLRFDGSVQFKTDDEFDSAVQATQD
jgi:prepilin-type processing-associated H-X9-DG protein